MISSLVFLLLAYVSYDVEGYSTFVSKIPNGYKVVNPCDRTAIWLGVGHQNSEGGGIRNIFGLNFNEKNQQWSPDLCKLDSDGDGKTNGEELGDPTCVWKVGDVPTRTQNITHPGICEPVDSIQCKMKNTWLQCTAKPPCPFIKGVKSVSLRFDRTNLPAIDTNYMCKKFALPSDQLYDVIADEPIVDNKLVAHHMLLYACENDTLWAKQAETWSCRMRVLEGCTSLIALWSSGGTGTCYPPLYGFRIGNGTDAFKYAVLQIHWTNIDLKADLWDSSGIKLYFTPKLRPNRAGVLQIGQFSLFLPPRIKYVTEEGMCLPFCSNSSLNNSIHITQAAMHMHLLGRKGSVGHWRNGVLLRYLFQNEPFDYNTPESKLYDSPIEFKPGDELRLSCTFDTSDRKTMTTYGESTLDEMCLAFFVYYPASPVKPFPTCGQSKHIGYCGNGVEEPTGCSIDKRFDEAVGSVFAACGQFEPDCSKGCKDAIDNFKETGCVGDSIIESLEANVTMKALYNIVDKCAILDSDCDATNAESLAGKILEHCDFDCEPACAKYSADYRETGCFDVANRYNMRNAPEVVAYVRSCEQFHQQNSSGVS